MSSFSERYKDYRITELLVILQNPEDYTPEAIKCARRELKRRQVSDNDRLLAQQKLYNNKQNSQQDIFDKIDLFLDNFKPIKDESKKADILLNRVCLLLLSIFVYYIIIAQEYFYVLFNAYQKISLLDLIYFGELFLLAFSIFSLYKRFLFARLLTSVFCVLKLIYVILFNLSFMFYLIITDIDSFHIENYQTYCITFILYSIILWLLFKPSIIKIFKK